MKSSLLIVWFVFIQGSLTDPRNEPQNKKPRKYIFIQDLLTSTEIYVYDFLLTGLIFKAAFCNVFILNNRRPAERINVNKSD